MKIKDSITFMTMALLGSLPLSTSAQTNTFPSSGNVGIGTTTPGAKVSFTNLDETTSADGITWYNPGPTGYGIFRTAGSWTAPDYQQLKLQWATGIALDPGTYYGKSYVDIMGGGLRVTSGNVGVGTTIPQGVMHLKSNTANLLLDKSSASYEALIQFAEAGNTQFYIYTDNADNGALKIQASGPSGEGDATPRMEFSRTDKNIYMAESGGNVGIGTTTPGSFRLAVEGKIGAREVVVTSTPIWPDYVFSDNYKLPSLLEVERYIKANKHLPDVPSAEQVKENGLSVGAMNTILLKKVEELTLHLIEIEKRDSELIEKVKKLENKLSKLQSIK